MQAWVLHLPVPLPSPRRTWHRTAPQRAIHSLHKMAFLLTLRLHNFIQTR